MGASFSDPLENLDATDRQDGSGSEDFQKGVGLYRQRKNREALRYLRSAIKDGYSRHDVYSYLGFALTDIGRWSEGRRAYRRVVKLCKIEAADHPTDPEVLNDLGIALAVLGDLRGALDAFEETTEAGALWSAPWKSKGRIQLSLAHPDKALDSFETALTNGHDPADAGYWIGRARFEMDQIELALASFDTAIELDVDIPSVHYWRGRSLNRLGRYSEARVSFELAVDSFGRDIVDKTNRPIAHFWRGYSLLELHRFLEAEADFNQSIRLLKKAGAEADNVSSAYAALAYSLCCAERHAEAVIAAQESLQIGPETVAALTTLAHSWAHTDRPDEAEVAIKRALVLQEDLGKPGAVVGSERHQWRVLCTEGAVNVAFADKYHDALYLDAAADSFRGALKGLGTANLRHEQEDAARIQLELGQVLARAGSYSAAADCFSRVIKATPPEASLRINASYRLRILRRYERSQIPRWLVVWATCACGGLLVVATVLLILGRLDSAAWVAIALATVFVPIATACLPYIRRLKLGPAEFTKDLVVTSEPNLPRLLPSPPRLRPRMMDWLSGSGRSLRSGKYAGEYRVSTSTPEPAVSAAESEQTGPHEEFAPQGPLETALVSKGTASVDAVREAIESSQVFVLGRPAGDLSVPGQGTESDLLHFTIDDKQGQEHTVLAVFTRAEMMREALIRNPEWQILSVLELKGRELLSNIDEDVMVVVNPWSPLEFQLPEARPPGAP